MGYLKSKGKCGGEITNYSDNDQLVVRKVEGNVANEGDLIHIGFDINDGTTGCNDRFCRIGW